MEPIFSQQMAEKGLAFQIDIDSTLPSSLILDEVRLRQVLLNLIGNAVKFTGSGYVKLVVQNQSPHADHSTLDLLFSVEDTGIITLLRHAQSAVWLDC